MGSWFRPKPKPPQTKWATFAVAVVDQVTQKPVEAADVLLSTGKSGGTNQDGYMAFLVQQNLPFSYAVYADGYENSVEQVVTLTGNLQVPVEMVPIIPPTPPGPPPEPPPHGVVRANGHVYQEHDQ